MPAPTRHPLANYPSRDETECVVRIRALRRGLQWRTCDGRARLTVPGMTLDAQGNIYATAGSGALAGIYVFGPRGEQLALITTPGEPSNCVFGIGNEASTLYITGAGPRPTGPGKRSYALYRVQLAIPGYHVIPPAKG